MSDGCVSLRFVQLVDTGRNDPCPCGSGRKYKKCCLADRDAALGTSEWNELAALVDAAIDSDDWSAVHQLVDFAMPLFEAGEPLEHVRFCDNDISVLEPHALDFPKLCSSGWLARCDLEMVRVLAHVELDSEERDGLRMALYLLRRLGAGSPIVEELASMQVDEVIARRRRFADTVSARGLDVGALKAANPGIEVWLRTARPQILPFADWFAMRLAGDDVANDLWAFGVARRACEACLQRLPHVPADAAPSWSALAGLALVAAPVGYGRILALETAPYECTPDEDAVYQAIVNADYPTVHDRIPAIIRASEARGDYAGAAVLREMSRFLQALVQRA
jgi:hypothetical protein